MSKNTTPIRMSEEVQTFCKTMRVNRIKLGLPELESYSASLELIAKYFKQHNDQYVQMLKHGEEQC